MKTETLEIETRGELPFQSVSAPFDRSNSVRREIGSSCRCRSCRTESRFFDAVTATELWNPYLDHTTRDRFSAHMYVYAYGICRLLNAREVNSFFFLPTARRIYTIVMQTRMLVFHKRDSLLESISSNRPLPGFGRTRNNERYWFRYRTLNCRDRHSTSGCASASELRRWTLSSDKEYHSAEQSRWNILIKRSRYKKKRVHNRSIIIWIAILTQKKKKVCSCQKLNIHDSPTSVNLNALLVSEEEEKLWNLRKMLMQTYRQVNSFLCSNRSLGRFNINYRSAPSSYATRLQIDRYTRSWIICSREIQ